MGDTPQHKPTWLPAKFSLGLRGRLLILVGLTLAPAFAVTWYSSLQIRQQTMRTAEQHAYELALGLRDRLNDQLFATRSLLSLLARTPEVKAALNGDCSKLVKVLPLTHAHKPTIGVISATGQVSCVLGGSIGFARSKTHEAFFQRAASMGHFALGDVKTGRGSARDTITAAYPIWGPRRRLAGIMSSALSLGWLDTAARKHNVGMGTISYVVQCRKGTVIGTYPAHTLPSIFANNPRLAALSCPARPKQQLTLHTDIGGHGWILSSLPVGIYTGMPQLHVVMALPSDQLVQSEHRIALQTFSLLGILALISLLIAWFAGDPLLLRPIRRLLTAVAGIEKGMLSTRALISSGPREIRRLGLAFDTMASALEDRQAKAENQLRRIKSLNRIQQVLSAISTAIVRIRDTEQLLREACDIAVEIGGFAFAYVALVEPSCKTVRIVAHAGDAADFVTQLYLTVDPNEPQGRGLIGTSIRENRGVISNAAQDAPQLAPWREQFVKLGIESAAALPLRTDDRAIGAIAFYSDEPRFFNTQEMKLLAELAADVSLGLESIEKDHRIHQLAYWDALTDLPNRSLFELRLRRGKRRVDETDNRLVVIALGVTEYGVLNDISGRAVADQLIKTVAQRLSTAVDSYYPQGRLAIHLARITLEEFAIAIEDDDLLQNVFDLMAQIRNALMEPARLGGVDSDIVYSVGAAIYPKHCAGIDELLHKAQFALHHQDSNNKLDTLPFYVPEKDHEARDRHNLESALRRALDNGEFRLAYQPRIHALTRQPIGVEALLRWDRPGHGPVPPDRFIPVLEASGMITRVGEWVLRTALAQRCAWKPIVSKDFVMSVNASAYELFSHNYAQKLRDLIEAFGLNAGQIEIELTETGLIFNGSSTVGLLQALKAVGVRLSVDDFGTGYSALSYLHQFPLDTLKIDQRFIQDISHNTGSLSIVRSIISLAKALELDVVAEGVEKQEQLNILIKEGCNEIQGYYFSPPEAPEVIESTLTLHNDLTHE